MGRTEGAKNKNPREHLKDAEIAKLKAEKAALKAQLKEAKKK
jgi:hypothetical protein